MSKPGEPQITEAVGASVTNQVFRPYERPVQIKALGKSFEVPEKNTILRCFQYINPETIPYGRFFCNQVCQNFCLTGTLAEKSQHHQWLRCKSLINPGMDIRASRPELT